MNADQTASPPDREGNQLQGTRNGTDVRGTGSADELVSRHRMGIAIAALCIASVLVYCVYVLSAQWAEREVRAAGERQLQIMALDLESVLDKFETLPFALGYQAEVVQALATPQDRAVVARLNHTLHAIQRQSRVVAIYMMDRAGNTIASSNWDQPLSFVGRNFGFRPYFQDAMRGQAGRFYGIGSATGEPGYFIAQPIYADPVQTGERATPVGVMAVKIDLAEFEHTWRSSEEPVALVDSVGVVFLSSRPAWKYHSLQLLEPVTANALAGTLQYAGRPILPIGSLNKHQRADFSQPIARKVGRLGWQLMLFPASARIARSAALAAAAAALLLAIAAISTWAVYQRRRRLEERMLSRHALQRAAEELDRRIAQRTGELLDANRHLEEQYVRLQQTEHLLRSTQNELIQAGKLTMLGQMAAGVTHELNQPLAAIRAFADNAVTFLVRGQGEQAQANLVHISNAAARMGAIIGQLKGFARKSAEPVTTVDLARSIDASAVLLHNDFQRCGALLELDLRERLCVTGDTVRTEQVLINLMRNALEAVESMDASRGSGEGKQSDRMVRVILERDGQGDQAQAVIRVIDSGPGISDEAANHLFDPFFTTKSNGRGLGLGLAISSSIVQAMNGELTARNHPLHGAEFIVRLPLMKQGDK